LGGFIGCFYYLCKKLTNYMKTFKRTCALFVATILFSAVAFAAPKREYVDATTLTVINKAHNDGLPLRRVDIEKFDIPNFAKSHLPTLPVWLLSSPPIAAQSVQGGPPHPSRWVQI
jgi:hypothetical protein